MTTDQLKELEALESKATPWPWRYDANFDEFDGPKHPDGGRYAICLDNDNRPDGKLILALRKHAKELIRMALKADAFSAEAYETQKRLEKAERELEQLGFRRCDIAACNCGGYHQQIPEPEV